MLDKITEGCAFLQEKGILNPEIGIILGTGLGNLFAKQIENARP